MVLLLPSSPRSPATLQTHSLCDLRFVSNETDNLRNQRRTVHFRKSFIPPSLVQHKELKNPRYSHAGVPRQMKLSRTQKCSFTNPGLDDGMVSPSTNSRTSCELFEVQVSSSSGNQTPPTPLGECDLKAPKESIPGLRQPPVDPRKSRRYCTDFGLSYADAKPPLPTPSPQIVRHCVQSLADCTFTPTSTHDGTMSDSASLLDRDFASEFPQPPPISPVLRRMRSSPWYNEGSSGNKDLLERSLEHNVYERRRPCSISPIMPRLKTGMSGNFDCWNSRSSKEVKNVPFFPVHSRRFSEDVDLEVVGEALMKIEMNSVNSNLRNSSRDDMDVMADAPVNLFSVNMKSSTTTDLLRWSISHRIAPTIHTGSVSSRPESILKNSSTSYDHQEYLTKKPQSHQIGFPRIIRKVASMKLDPRPNPSSTQRPVPKIRSLRFLSQSSDMTSQQTKNKDTTHHRNWSFARGHSGGINRETQKLDVTSRHNNGYRDYRHSHVPPLLEVTEHQKPSHRQQMSLPLNGLGFADTSSNMQRSPRKLAAPFHHKAGRSAVNVTSAGQSSKMLEVPKSFMDITPERIPQSASVVGVRRERVKKLLVRASNGVVEWGRHFTKKGGSRV